MAAFAYYRLPYKQDYTFIRQEDEPEELQSLEELNGKSGFVFAPFVPSNDCPILLMHPDTMATHYSEWGNSLSKYALMPDNSLTPKSSSLEKSIYANDFNCFHEHIKQGKFQKLVLARHEEIRTNTVQAEELFKKACEMYPRLFIALVSTPQSGTWLMATPEILLSGNRQEMGTMALAGTQTAPPSAIISDVQQEGVKWSKKNLEEQQYVADYIEDIITSFSDSCSKKGPYTTMAAQLYHLRTDFHFRLTDTEHLGNVLDQLYPTPAVCGMPKEAARRFIIHKESIDRKYYSGFVGSLQPHGETQLYVSLRCMNIHEDGICELYAGGGLLEESELQKEWDETEAKLATMKTVIQSFTSLTSL